MSEMLHDFAAAGSAFSLAPDDRLLTMAMVREQVPMSERTIWRWIAQGRFPRGRKVTPGTTLWLQSEVTNFINKTANQPA